MKDPVLAPIVQAIAPVRGIVAIVLGGSRARGAAGPASDYDIGLYYEPTMPLDVAALQSAIAPLVGNLSTMVTPIGEWGPWINGGGWLTIANVKVDLLYRDLEHVRSVIEDARSGRVSMHYQPGHPHGFCSAIWMGEVATCQPLFDPLSCLAKLKAACWPFPTELKDALVIRFGWEVQFAIENAELAIKRLEQTHVAGCAYRALCCIAQVLFAVNGRYLVNEKGAIAEAAAYPITIEGLARAQSRIWRDIGEADYDRALDRLRSLSDSLRAIIAQDQVRTCQA